MKHRIPDELRGIFAFVGAVWCVFLLGWIAPIDINRFGITPRTVSGLVGVVAAPFLHGSLGHLISNTIPLFVLLTLLAGSRVRSWDVVVELVLVSGALLWVVGRSGTHVGASGLVFGLVAFLIVSGFLEKRVIPLAVAVLVGLLYGGTLLAGVLPQFGSSTSWDGHLCGAAAGGLIAYLLTGRRNETAGA